MLVIVVRGKDKVDDYALQQRHPLHRIALQHTTSMKIRLEFHIDKISSSPFQAAQQVVLVLFGTQAYGTNMHKHTQVKP